MDSNCPLCNSSKTNKLWQGKGTLSGTEIGYSYACANDLKFKPTIFKCNECRHLFSDKSTWPSKTGEDYAQVVDTNYLALEKVKSKTFQRAARIADGFFSQPKRMIEVGSYTGVFLSAMEQNGWECTGIEPSRWAAEISRTKGFNVLNGTLDQIVGQGLLVPVDLVVSWDVLEHVISPRDFMTEICNLVSEKGILIISTLDRTNYFARVTGKNWPWIVNMHLHYFDQETVIKMAAEQGFRLIRTRPHVHYATISYILEKILGHRSLVNLLSSRTLFSRISLPIGFGDVRYYVFEKN